MLVSLRDVRAGYGGRAAVRLAQLDIAAGEHTLLLGPSGCGKTTLLNVIAGIAPVMSGEVRINGELLGAMGESARDRFRGANIGLIMQRLHLIGALSVEANLKLAQSLAGKTVDATRIQSVLTSLGVADRFMSVKRQRDLAREQSRMFEALAERDPLTGLLNRRGVEERFDDLLQQGYAAMAVIDLDRFKDVNDSHGHAVGDLVLRAAAEALAPDEDTLAVRMGGEEFVLLLRGRSAAARAERRRRAITTRIAADVPGLPGIVTASMGLVEHPEGMPPRTGFLLLYAHCDRLLYEAKHAGRNRTMSERVQGFAMPAAGMVGAA